MPCIPIAAVHLRVLTALLAALAGCARAGSPPMPSSSALGQPVAQDSTQLQVIRAADVEWNSCIPSPAAGCAATTVLRGNPRRSEVFTIRTKVSAGFQAPPHFHETTEECVTVISGGPFHVATGDTLDTNSQSGHLVGPGDFYCVPPGVHHFVWADAETIVQIHGLGPFTRTLLKAPTERR